MAHTPHPTTPPTHCDACVLDVKHAHGPAAQLWTFGLVYTWGVEEVDVWASDRHVARVIAERVADAGYQSGWTHIEQLPAGGSAGLVWWQR